MRGHLPPELLARARHRPLLGVSGRAILAALAAGETDVERLVALAHPRLRAKRDALRGREGYLPAHHLGDAVTLRPAA